MNEIWIDWPCEKITVEGNDFKKKLYESQEFNFTADRGEMNYVAGSPYYFQWSSSLRGWRERQRLRLQSYSFNRWVMAGIDRGTYQSRWMKREVVLLVRSADIMKLGIEIARTARVRTWCQRRNNLEVLARRAVRLTRCIGCTARTHARIRARANSCVNILVHHPRSKQGVIATLSGGKCVRLTRGTILCTLCTWGVFLVGPILDFSSEKLRIENLVYRLHSAPRTHVLSLKMLESQRDLGAFTALHVKYQCCVTYCAPQVC